MSTTIVIKNSSTAGLAPSAGQLVQGELAVNVTDKKIYTLNSSGTVVLLSSGSDFTIPVTVTVNSSLPAVTITQTGSGAALLVEDSANPDSTPFVVSTTGDVGIGTGTPAAKLDVIGNSLFTGNITLVGSARRFTGDFTNATVASRSMFQTSTVDSSTGIYALPNGTSTAASWQATNNSDPTNASKILIATNGATDVQLVSGINGTGTYLPLTFYNSGTEKLRIGADLTGTYTFGGTAPRITGDFSNATVANRVMFQTSTVNDNTQVSLLPNGTGTISQIQMYSKSDPANASRADVLVFDANDMRIASTRTGTGTYLPMTLYTSGSERVRVDTSGNVNIATTGVAAKLYVSGNAAQNIAALVDAATIAVDMSTANNFSVTLGGNRTLGNPTGLIAGQSGVIFITQDATGSRTLAYSSFWDFSGGAAPTLTTTANAVDALVYTVRTSTAIVATLITNVG